MGDSIWGGGGETVTFRRSRFGKPSQGQDALAVRLEGGLGNQLFQFAAGYANALRLGCRLLLDRSSLYPHGKREFQLDFVLSDRIAIAGAGDLRHMKVLRESGFSYDPLIVSATTGSILVGYFQSWRYFDDVATEIVDYLAERLSLIHVTGSFSGICVHARRGDYRVSPHREFHGLVGDGFVLESVHLARRLSGRPDLACEVFSDEEAEATRLASLIPNALASQAVGSAQEVLHAMARHSYFAISNSSFSWWGAYLAPHSPKVVIAPRPWFKDPLHDTRDLLPAHWLTLDHRFV